MFVQVFTTKTIADCLWTGDAYDLLGHTSFNYFFKKYFHANHPGLFLAPDCPRNKISNWYGFALPLGEA